MELKDLTEKTISLFKVENPAQLGNALINACDDPKLLESFCELINNELETDWLQKIYQYYLADRKEKKQDYTPASIAKLMGMLAGDSEKVVDMCAGSGALIIQKWSQNKNTEFTAIEIDGEVIPFLLFNMVIRNIRCDVLKMNALTDNDPDEAWRIEKGERFGRIVNYKPTI